VRSYTARIETLRAICAPAAQTCSVTLTHTPRIPMRSPAEPGQRLELLAVAIRLLMHRSKDLRMARSPKTTASKSERGSKAPGRPAAKKRAAGKQKRAVSKKAVSKTAASRNKAPARYEPFLMLYSVKLFWLAGADE
jgi:hypothetical protein